MSGLHSRHVSKDLVGALHGPRRGRLEKRRRRVGRRVDVFLLKGVRRRRLLGTPAAAGEGTERGLEQAEWHARPDVLSCLLCFCFCCFVSFEVAIVVASHVGGVGGVGARGGEQGARREGGNPLLQSDKREGASATRDSRAGLRVLLFAAEDIARRSIPRSLSSRPDGRCLGSADISVGGADKFSRQTHTPTG